MPRRHFVSVTGRALYGYFLNVKYKILEKQRRMDLDTQKVLGSTLYNKIREIEDALRNQRVRIHLDPSFASPDVTERSVFEALLLRLKRQIDASCVLADLCSLGPAANAEESAALSTAESVLDLLDQAISPVSSLDGSNTESDFV
ncbi:unnamed protein product [Auanema sp. JU1783]|nr:unnamed protein product [Auanema sp. JU1783]